MQKECSKCKKTFVCGFDTGSCWCQDLEIEKTELEKLNNNYESCLCKECLLSYAKNSMPSVEGDFRTARGTAGNKAQGSKAPKS